MSARAIRIYTNEAAKAENTTATRQIAAALALTHAVAELARQLGRLADLGEQRTP